MPRQRIAAALLTLGLLGACGPSAQQQIEARTRTFLGGVVADEPRAALAGLRALEQGGTAADAVVATFFALTVTYPVAAGIGGGGVCLAYDGLGQIAESIDFLPREAEAGGTIAVPGSVRGMAAVHARFGRLRWTQVVQPGEELARFGHDASRALARSVDAYVTTTGNTNLGRLTPGGNRPGEGQRIEQPELADLLALIRARGAGDLYGGEAGRAFVDATSVGGGRVSMEDLRRFLPEWTRSTRADLGVLGFHTAPGPASGGPLASMIWTMVTDQQRYVRANAEERAHLMAEAIVRAFGDRAAGAELSAFRSATLMNGFDFARRTGSTNPAPVDLSPWANAGSDGSTSLVAVDRVGNAIACSLTMNAPFGVGRLAAVLGTFPAPARPLGPPGWLRTGSDYLTPALLTNTQTGELVVAMAANGGPAAAPAAVTIALRGVIDAQPLPVSLATPRILATARPDKVFVEAGTDPGVRAGLTRRGHVVEEGRQFGQVAAILCFGGLRLDPLGCQFASDRRGFGLATGGTGP